MFVGLYYNLNVDYVTQIQEEFGTTITHTNVSNGVSCAHYFILILKEVYEYERILVPLEDVKAEFSTLQTLKLVVDDPTLSQCCSHS